VQPKEIDCAIALTVKKRSIEGVEEVKRMIPDKD
jgi:hypothetical protein